MLLKSCWARIFSLQIFHGLFLDTCRVLKSWNDLHVTLNIIPLTFIKQLDYNCVAAIFQVLLTICIFTLRLHLSFGSNDIIKHWRLIRFIINHLLVTTNSPLLWLNILWQMLHFLGHWRLSRQLFQFILNWHEFYVLNISSRFLSFIGWDGGIGILLTNFTLIFIRLLIKFIVQKTILFCAVSLYFISGHLFNSYRAVLGWR